MPHKDADNNVAIPHTVSPGFSVHAVNGVVVTSHSHDRLEISFYADRSMPIEQIVDENSENKDGTIKTRHIREHVTAINVHIDSLRSHIALFEEILQDIKGNEQ